MIDEEAIISGDDLPRLNRRALKLLVVYTLAGLSFCITSITARSQSTLADAPTPLVRNAVEGSIAPRDIGDSRTTTYFFTFDTAQGDLEITVTSENLEGDIDLYVLGSLQPLTKVTLLATGSVSEVRRTIFVRDAAPLLLRVQARSPGDAVGVYRISFSGAFLPSSRAIIAAKDNATSLNQNGEIAADTATTNRSTQRVNAVGGRIEEPIEPTRAPSLPAVSSESDDASEEAATIVSPRATRRTPRRSGTTTARRRSPRPPRPATPTRRTTSPPASDADTEDTASTSTTPPPTSSRRANSARSRSPAAPRPKTISRLIIRTRDGTRIERSMSEVERVTIESGELIVVLKSGETQRLDLTDVLRFSVEP